MNLAIGLSLGNTEALKLCEQIFKKPYFFMQISEGTTGRAFGCIFGCTFS